MGGMRLRETPTARPALASSPCYLNPACVEDAWPISSGPPSVSEAAGALESPKGASPCVGRSRLIGGDSDKPGAGNPRWYFRVLPAPYHMVGGPTTRRRTTVVRGAEAGSQ